MSEAPIRLTELIAELRRELTEAQAQGQGQPLRLRVEEAEIELQVVLTREKGAGAGVKFWVFNADLQDKNTDATTQKIKLKLKPSTEDGGDVTIAAQEEAPPQPKRAKRTRGMRAAE